MLDYIRRKKIYSVSHKRTKDIYFTRYKIRIELIKVQIFSQYDVNRKSNASFQTQFLLSTYTAKKS